MKEIIYISFLFNSHWCAGVVQLKDDNITYWKDGKYQTENIVSKNDIDSKKIIKTDKGTLLLIGKKSIKYFSGNNLVTLYIK